MLAIKYDFFEVLKSQFEQHFCLKYEMQVCVIAIYMCIGK